MSGIWFYLIFLVSIFFILGVALKIFPKDASFTIAIGAVIGANIYNASAYPIEIGGLVCGIDSIVYTIFAFCLLFMYIFYGKKDMKVVLYTSMFSIFFTAFLFLMGNISQTGYTDAVMLSFLSYLSSILATYLAVHAMVWVFQKLRSKNTNIFLSILVALIVVLVVNSTVYFGLSVACGAYSVSNFWATLGGSFVGKFIASMCCLVIFAFHYKKKKVERGK